MSESAARPYRKGKRAEAEKRTRRRITEAAVELHGTVGPAKTTISDVAKRAGVSRMTVYHHFPTDVDLFTACSTHWAAANPFPDPARWTLADRTERLTTALSELYEWYGLNQQMLGNVLRDVGLVPALSQVMDGLWGSYTDSLVQVLADGWREGGAPVESIHAVLRLAVDFNTWRILTECGLGDRAAAELMVRVVTQAVG